MHDTYIYTHTHNTDELIHTYANTRLPTYTNT